MVEIDDLRLFAKGELALAASGWVVKNEQSPCNYVEHWVR